MGILIVAAVAALLFVVVLPILIVGALIGAMLYALFWLLFLPLRLLGWTLAAGLGVFAIMIKFFLLFVLGLVGMALTLALLTALALPLLPFMLVAAGIWLLVRSRRPARPAAV
jgi:hypothetical protein